MITALEQERIALIAIGSNANIPCVCILGNVHHNAIVIPADRIFIRDPLSAQTDVLVGGAAKQVSGVIAEAAAYQRNLDLLSFGCCLEAFEIIL